MSTAVRVTPHHDIETATRYIHAAPTVAALFYPVALVAFYSGGRMVHDASTWEAWLSGWIVTLGGRNPCLRSSRHKLPGNLCPRPGASTEPGASSGTASGSPSVCQSASLHRPGRHPQSLAFQQRLHRLGTHLDTDQPDRGCRR